MNGLLLLAATMRLMSYNAGHCVAPDGQVDVESVVRTINVAQADYVGLHDVDWHARRTARADQPALLASRCGYLSSYTTDHFLYETPDEQHGVAILARERPRSQVIKPLPAKGKGKVLLICEFTDCYVGVTEFDADPEMRRESQAIVAATVAELSRRKPVYMVDDQGGLPTGEHRLRDIEVADPKLPAPAVVPRPAELKLQPGWLALPVLEPTPGDLRQRVDPTVAPEGYRLRVTASGIEASAADAAGFFYALQTLRQLGTRYCGRLYFPAGEICDWPRFPWRGMMIDDSRHFFGKLAMRRTLDLMAYHKLNMLHWHLTDDQGWRLPVPGRERLTREGAIRELSTDFNEIGDRDTNGVYGPYAYTEKEIRDLVAYARARQVQIVPEVDLPGHCAMALKAYPELGCFPDAAQAPAGAVNNVLCLGKDSTLDFMREVVARLAELFPDAEYLHLGGDEVNKFNWSKCPHCQARMRAVGAKNGVELQAWFTGELAAAVAAQGKRFVGWTEVLYGGMVPEGAVLMSWLGAEGGIAAAKAGRDSVMCPHTFAYYNYSQELTDDPFEYPWWSIPLSLEKAYNYDPLAGLPESARPRILGGQVCLWSNMIPDEPELQWKAWPRTCASAEVYWSPESARDFADFRRRMEVHRRRLLAMHVNCAPLE